MAERELIRASALDYDGFAALQREAFAELLSESGSTDAFMTPEYYRWKYHTAGEEALVAVVWDGGKMVASNGMMPCTLSAGALRVRGWQSCDTATIPAARGQGHFVGCLEILGEALEENEVFFGFPNQSSVRGFRKMGWEELSPVPVWVRPPLAAPWRWSRHVSRASRLDERHDELAERLTALGDVMIHRTAAYLRWRYLEHPLYRYTVLVYERRGEPLGLAVVRAAEAMGLRLTVVLELWALTRRVERSLLEHVGLWAARKLTAGVVIMDSGLSTAGALRAGLVGVPSRLLPKRQVLMGRATRGAAAERVIAGPFRAQMGDWDVF